MSIKLCRVQDIGLRRRYGPWPRTVPRAVAWNMQIQSSSLSSWSSWAVWYQSTILARLYRQTCLHSLLWGEHLSFLCISYNVTDTKVHIELDKIFNWDIYIDYVTFSLHIFLISQSSLAIRLPLKWKIYK